MRAKAETNFRPVLEGAILFGGIFLLDWLIPSSHLLSASPHPFWLPVLLLSVQYGLFSGVVSCFAAIILLQVASPFVQQMNEDYFSYGLRIWTEPVLWLLSALMIGAARSRQIAATKNDHEKLRQFERERKTLVEHNQSLEAAIDKFQREFVTSDNTGDNSVLAQLEQLRALPSDLDVEAFQQTIHALIGPCHVTLITGDKSVFAAPPEVDTLRTAKGDHQGSAETTPDRLREQLIVLNGGRQSRQRIRLPLRAPSNGKLQGILVLEDLKRKPNAQDQILLDLIATSLGSALLEESQNTATSNATPDRRTAANILNFP
ncbi:MAG: hypothetical protein HWE23_03125 [Rhodobacteraceae bacterium]|nr:hypothetical protein [Paracoccaceae bacterium]